MFPPDFQKHVIFYWFTQCSWFGWKTGSKKGQIIEFYCAKLTAATDHEVAYSSYAGWMGHILRK